MPADKINEVSVFKVIPSPIKNQVKIAYELIPSAKPTNLPGHNRPSKCSTAYLVASINEYDIAVPIVIDKISGFFSNHFQRNCPLV